MKRGLGNKKFLIIIASVIGVLLIAGGVVAISSLQSNDVKKDPYAGVSVEEVSESDTTKETEVEKPVETAPEVTVDPANVSTVDIAPLEVTVSYVKGIQGFEYAVKRTQNGGQYVEFNAPALMGTKCTNDIGVFASIVKNPQAADQATLTVTKKVGEDSFGLSLPQATCTGDTALFDQYQASFKDAFGLIKPISAASTE